MDFTEYTYWNTRSYGQAIRIRKRTAQAALVTICMVTPFTNWLIPFVRRLISNDVVYRYE